MNHWTRLALGALCALALLTAGASSALALSPTNAPLAGSNFQGGDGNQDNPAGDVSSPPDGVNDIDWQALAGSIPTTIDNNAVDSMFEGGDKETEPGAWGITSKAGGVTPSKDNLLAAWSTSSPNVSGPPNTFLDLAFTRAANTGNTFNTFELNQLAQTWNNGQSNIACRTTGDLLISYEVASGGTPPNVDIVVYRWTSSTVDAATGCGKTGTFQALNPGPNAQAAMNGTAITNFLSPGTLGSSFAAGEFGEAALNLTAILSGANLNPCANFGQISMHTRSSTSIDSQLQDYIAPVPVLVRSCSLQITKTGSSPHHDGDAETFNYDVTNDGSVPVTVSKSSNTGVTDDKCGPVTYVSGDTNNDGKVDTNETWHFTCAYTVKHSDENASHDIINTAAVHGTVGSTPVTRSTTYSTHVIHPAIDVTKTATESAVHVGDTIHYTVTVKNTGDTSLTVTPADTGCTSFNNSSFTLAAGASKQLTCTHVASAGDGSSYNNEACAQGVDSIGGPNGTVSDCDNVTVTIIHPSIKVTKTAAETAVHVGDTIHYTIKVENTGDTALTVTPSDLGCTGLDATPFSLAAGASKNLSCTHTATAGDGASYKNEACAQGVDSVGGAKGTVSDCDDVTVPVLHPGIQVTKAANEAAVHVGETIHYTVTVHNTGDVSLTVSPSDLGCDGFNSADFTLAAGASKDITCTHQASAGDGGSYKNEACADGVDSAGGKVSDCGDVTTEIIHPAIKVVKTADPKVAHDGDPVAYGYTVTNEGDTPLSDVHVSDDRCAPVTPTASAGHNVGDTNGDDKLDLGEVWKYTCDYTVKHADENGSGDITNVVIADGTDKLGKTVTDDDSQTIHIIHPAISVTKNADQPSVHVGDAIHYTITVTNTGDTALTVTPSDTGCTGLDATAFNLAAGASKDITCTHQASAGDGGSYKNEACALGVDSAGGKVSDCGDVTTEIIHPAIKVVKSGTPTTVHDADSVTYSYDVTNEGDTPLENIHLGDDKCASPAYVSGDTNNDNKLDLAETWHYTCTYSAKHSDEANDHKITNTATADGTDKLGETVTDGDTFTILVVHPGITVTKTAGESAVHVGDTIHYTVKVENTGDTALTVNPSDTQCANFDGSSFSLAAGASKTLTCEHVATGGDGGSYTNQACAQGVDSVGGDKGTVSDCDSVEVPVLHPGIKVTKTADHPAVHVGDTIHYTVKVENTGDTDLTVTPSDTKCDGFAGAAFTLKAGDSKELSCTHTVVAGDGTAYTNEACADGVDSIDGKVSDCSDVTTEVIHPAIHIDKTERVQGDPSYVDGPIDAFVGDTVEYEMKVTNPGDTPLDVVFTDARCDNGTLSGPSGDTDNDGKLDPSETWAYHCSHFVANADKPTFTNTAHADGTDKLGETVSDEDSVVANVRDFQIAGMKFEDQNANGQRDAGEPGIAGWTIYLDANDNGQLDPGETSVKTGANGNYSFNSLDPGSYVVREEQPSGWHCSTPNPCEYKLTLKSRDPDKSGIDFGNWHDSSVAGVKFHDRNANGARDAGEEGLGGWTFYVDYNGNGSKDAGEPSATSAADGSYTIGGIKPGTYAVREVGHAGWTCSFPGTCEYDLSFKSNDAKTGADFGNWEPASVSGTKFEDKNNNGVHDAGEGPLQGFTFYVDYNGNGSLDAGEPSAVSAADGSWTISGIKPGTFNVLEVADPNYTCTFPGTGAACKYEVSLQAGDAQAGKEFGNAPPAQIVSPAHVTPGTAKLAGRTGCVAKAFSARVRGKKIQSVTFVLDGKTIKRFTKTNKAGLYSVRINPQKMRIGVHRLVVSVTFQKGSGTKPKKLRLSFQRCAKKLAAPRFTG